MVSARIARNNEKATPVEERSMMAATNGEKPLELSVRNFGPIAEGRVELRPFTVFVGPSNTGKSYLATLIYALHRFFGFYYGRDKNTILPGGAFPAQYLKQSAQRTGLSSDSVASILEWTAEGYHAWGEGGSEYQEFSAKELPTPVLTLVRAAVTDADHWSAPLSDQLVRCFGMVCLDNLIRNGNGSKAGFAVRGSVRNGERHRPSYECKVAIHEGVKINAMVEDVLPLQNSQWFPPHFATPWTILHGMESSSDEEKEAVAAQLLAAYSNVFVSDSVGPLSQPAHYLLTSRANLMHTHQTIVQSLIAGASQPTIAPTFSGLLGDFLERIVGLGNQRNQREASEYPLALDLERNVVGGEIRIASNPVGYPEFLYRPYGWERDLPLANTSSMVSELAPVVLYLRHVVQPGDTLIIEEPESHLHPAMQVEFTRLLAAAVKAGIRIIITTHSEWVLEELANLVLMSELPVERREGFEGADLALSPEELGVWSFQPTEDGSVVEELRFDEEAGKFPSDAGLVTVELYNRFARIANRIERLKED